MIDNHLKNKNIQYPFFYKEAYDPISLEYFSKMLDKAITGNKEAIKYIDDCTINRKYGFDFYMRDYWKGIKKHESICAFAVSISDKYKFFRDNQAK